MMTDPSPGTLRDFVLDRTGVPLGAPGSLSAMLRRSLGAPSFAAFWHFWNPIWGYNLKHRVFQPLRRILPWSLSVIITFTVSGALHDAAVWVVSGTTNGLFALSFTFMGLGVLVGRAASMDMSAWPMPARAAIHIAYVSGCVVVARMILA